MKDIYEFMKKLSAVKQLGEDIALEIAEKIEKRLSADVTSGAQAKPEAAAELIVKEYSVERIPQRRSGAQAAPRAGERAAERGSAPEPAARETPTAQKTPPEPVKPTAAPQTKPRMPKPLNVYERISVMRGIAMHRENRGKSEAEIFRLQAVYMQDFRDSFQYPERDSMLTARDWDRISYGKLAVIMLRRYFTWRTRLESGQDAVFDPRFICLRAAELVNLAGASSPEDAFDKLKRLRELSKRDLYLSDRFDHWLMDMAVTHGLPRELTGEMRCQYTNRDLLALAEPEKADDERLFKAVNLLSDYRPKRSKLYEARPRELTAAVCTALRLYSKRDHAAYFGRFAGEYKGTRYEPFQMLCFFEPEAKRDYSYAVDPTVRFRCVNGKWWLDRLVHEGTHVHALGAFIKNIDCALRRALSMRGALKTEELPQDEAAAVKRAVQAVIDRKQREERPKLELDLTKLSSIREQADDTRDMLLAAEKTDEEGPGAAADGRAPAPAETIPGEQPPAEPSAGIPGEQPPAEPPTPEKTTDAAEQLPQTAFTPELQPAGNGAELTAAERTLLACLLNGEPYEAPLRALGVFPSVAADGLNEKLMELIGDTVIIEEGGALAIVEDYLDDLKGLIK